ncbi:hypothetical protein F443_00557 [Phytophthora nicotianae P1569]|uniref:Uncharacterized protein n=1 Tax=Phytophthora nicotianae P1569 TaxID=1317065 RepID=V9G2N2_PHYNI|nr:hypothetical protein F443_00557 [Phytophthora nicotianae P1569]
MSKGNILLYRGDFILAPVAYETNNLFLHALLDTPFTQRHGNHHPRIVQEFGDLRCTGDPFCFVWKCTFKGSPLALRRHMNRFHGIRFRRLSRSALP